MEKGALQFAVILLAIHWVPLLIAAWAWPIKQMRRSIWSVPKIALGVIASLLVLLCLLIFTDVDDRGGQGNAAGWYMIYSVVTLGVVPVFFILVHVTAGRYLGWIVRWRRARRAALASDPE